MENLKANPGDMILCVSVTQLLKSNKRGSFYENVRKYWAIAAEKIPLITHVAVVNKGIVVAVYPSPKWERTANPEWIGRWEFSSENIYGDPDSPYLGKYMRMCYGTKYVY